LVWLGSQPHRFFGANSLLGWVWDNSTSDDLIDAPPSCFVALLI